eukprot:m.192858 g.192858  ORF g.192858 m.192858 type:complete len:51 (-) comp15173_c0_seq10:1249-1401(-)
MLAQNECMDNCLNFFLCDCTFELPTNTGEAFAVLCVLSSLWIKMACKQKA